MRPVAGVGVDIKHDVIDEVVDIEQSLDLGVVAGHGEVLLHRALEAIPHHRVTLADLAELRNDVPLGLGAVPRVEEVTVNALGWVVVALELPVEVQVHERATRGDLPHVNRQATHQFVDDERVGVVVHPGPQHNVVEVLHLQPREKRITQSARPVVAAEVQPERILAGRRPGVRIVPATNVVAALHTQTGVGVQRLAGVRVNQFHRDWPLPRDAALGCIARAGLHDAGASP